MQDRLAEKRADLAGKLGIDINGLNPRVAAARLHVAVIEAITPPEEHRPTTDAQREISRQLDILKVSDSCPVAAIQISEALEVRNQEAMERIAFRPGMRVRFVGGPSVHPLAHQIGDEYEVSSVHPSGRVYFRGTTGFFAYASYLEPVHGEQLAENKENKERHAPNG
jgi:hypothetical protein